MTRRDHVASDPTIVNTPGLERARNPERTSPRTRSRVRPSVRSWVHVTQPCCVAVMAAMSSKTGTASPSEEFRWGKQA